MELTNDELSVSNTDDVLTASTLSLMEFSYIKNIDLTEEALQFMSDETAYYDIIKSYTSEKLSLFICVSGLVTAGAYYDSEGIVQEYFRNNDNSDKQFISIQGWYNDYYGEPVCIDKVLNNVFIGEDLVPLWKVLEHSSEVSEEEEEENENNGNDMDKDEDEDNFSEYKTPSNKCMVYVLASFSFLIIALNIFGSISMLFI